MNYVVHGGVTMVAMPVAKALWRRIDRRAILMIAASGLFARQEPTIRVDVQQVLVPVVVTDKKGRHVTGLRASDFRILEDGAPQDIASFSTDTAATAGEIAAIATPAAGAGEGTANGAPRHTFVICLDTLHASAADVPKLRQTLESAFEREKAAGAQYVLIAIGRQLQVLQPATTNPLALLVKIRSAAFPNALAGMDSSALEAQVQNLRTRMDEFCKRCACGARSGLRSCDSEIDTLKQNVDAEAERWAAPTKTLLEQFKSVVEELAKLQTGRTLILVSDGFYTDPKRDFYAVVSAYLPNRPQFRLEDSAADPTLRAALQVAVARNVIIDAIDSRTGAPAPLAGSRTMDASSGATGSGGDMLGTTRSASARPAPIQIASGAPTPLAAPEASSSMAELARATGGVYYHSSGDLSKEFRSALAEGREYYVLAYVSKNPAHDGKFRTITVEAADKKLTIRAKPGYWAPGEAQ